MSTLLLGLLADASIRASVLALLVAAILGGFRVRSSVVQHSVWTAVLCAMLLMPVLPYFFLPIAIPVTVRYVPDALADADALTASGSAVQRSAAGEATGERPRTAATGRSHIGAAINEAGTASSSSPSSGQPWRRTIWPDAALIVYACGSVVLSLRCWIGWRRARRLARTARCIHPANNCGIPARTTVEIAESAGILTPVTVGILASKVLLPLDWRAWPETRVRAILAHEFAHGARRDPLVSLLAQINRCLFWFHPLAWWLPRTLTRHAELVCDGIAIRAAGNAREYAQVLIDMTRAVREGGGRRTVHAAGIESSGFLGRRIDRIVRGDIGGAPSRARHAVVASTCAAAIVLVAACRPQSTPLRLDADSAVEQRDRKLRHDLLRNEIAADLRRVDWETGAIQLDALESALKQDPDNLDTLRALLLAYWIQPDAAKRRAQILRLIELHPDTALAGSVEARIFRSDRDRYTPFAGSENQTVSLPGDPEGYERAKNLWLGHASRPDVTPTVLGNAASFFESSDKPLAEQMLIRARALDPQGPWPARLGQFYATVLVGSHVLAARNIMRTVTIAEPRSGYGLGVRRTLAGSTDDVLLTAAGWFLARSTRAPWTGFDPVAWAESCFKRALQVNPHAVLAHTELLRLRGQDSLSRGEPLWNAPPALQYATVAALPEAERFARLPGLARSALGTLEDLTRWDDRNLADRRELARQQARKYAEDALNLAPKYRSHPKAGVAIYVANMTLGALALQDGDSQAAVGFLRKASEAPASEEMAYSDNLVADLHWHLAADLLETGERQAVMLFLERMAGINIARRTELREAAAAIRRGETPRIF
jgi:beta-lactamase regulating signal transducer with metallopeptidase domain